MLSKYFLDFYFNPRSHEGSDAITAQELPRLDEFQSTLPRRERHVRPLRCVVVKIYFNPRSHEGSDIRNSRNLHISIHAPTKGATPNASAICRISFSISIHAPTKGATFRAWKFFQDHEYFNPRSHEGSDGCSVLTIRELFDFNPRSHEGSDGTAGLT